jgi:hypothetical protein
MSRKSNQPLLDALTETQRAAVLDGADALKELHDFRRLTFEKWMRVARGVAAICIIADRPTMSRKARQHLLRDNGYGTLNPSTVTRLKHMAEHDTAIRVWRDTLTENKRDSWNSPTSICNRCPAVRKAIEADKGKKPPRRPRTVNRPAKVEQAIDTITDYLRDLKDDDQRAVIIERIKPELFKGGGKSVEPLTVETARAAYTKALVASLPLKPTAFSKALKTEAKTLNNGIADAIHQNLNQTEAHDEPQKTNTAATKPRAKAVKTKHGVKTVGPDVGTMIRTAFDKMLKNS